LEGQELLDEQIGLGHLLGVLLCTQMLSYFDVVYTDVVYTAEP
jgi:hypothetical protein